MERSKLSYIHPAPCRIPSARGARLPDGQGSAREGMLKRFLKGIMPDAEVHKSWCGIHLAAAVLIISFVLGGFSFSAPPGNKSPAVSAPSKVAVQNTKPSVPASLLPVATVDEEEKIISLINKALPSVVNIVGSKLDQNGNKEVITRGTGFVVDPKGLLLTNRHVVSQDNLTYTVFFSDGSKYLATILGRDPLNDLAIVQILGDKFPALPLANSDKIRIGQTVVAIGNSLGRYSNTVTKGIISGLGRSVAASDNITGQTETLDDVIQTDAAINLGNSGGPLLNSKGEVLGINTAIEQSGRGVGFAIPINDAKKVLESYSHFGRIVRPYLGVRYVTVTSDIQDEFKLSYDYGALINAGELASGPAVVPGSPAEKAGLKTGDVILGVNGVLVRGNITLLKLIQQKKPGDFITLLVARGKAVLNIEATIVELPAYKP